MNTPTGKPLSNLSVHLRSWGAMALPQKELQLDMDFGKKMNRILCDSHIYLLCKRPAFSFNPDTFSWSKSHISGDLICKHNGIPTSFHFSFDLPLKEEETIVELDTKLHTDIKILNKKGECLRRLTAMGLSQHPTILEKDRSINDLEVLHIGNIFHENPRSIFERICHHASLQHFLNTLQQDMPDDDIIVYAFEYLPYELISLPGRLQHDKNDIKETRFISIQKHPLTEYQKICLAEAGLIHYFRPTWQERGDEILPHPSQAVFEGCKVLDMAGLVVELSTVRSHFRLYTSNSALLPHHMTMINLSETKERDSFFSIKT